MEVDEVFAPFALDFSDVADVSFHEGDSLIRDLRVDPMDDAVQVGGGRNDFDVRLINEKSLKTMGVKEVTYQLTFKDHLFRQEKKMREVKNLLGEAFDQMIDQVKKDLRPGDIVRGVVHNDALDLPVYIPFRPMEDMNAEAMLNSLEIVLNSNEDIPFDSSCQIDIGTIQYPRGGRGAKMSTLNGKIKKMSIIEIKNNDNRCLVRAILVALASACKTSNEDIQRLRSLHLKLTAGEMLLRFHQCPMWYYRDLLKNKNHTQDTLTRQICQTMDIVTEEPLSYAYLPPLEDFFNVSLYVISARRGDAFSYVSPHHARDRKKIFLYHDDREKVGHFHGIINITGFFASSGFCTHCLKAYYDGFAHNCAQHCNICHSESCEKGAKRTCPDCHRECCSAACFLRHKTPSEKGVVPCNVMYRCPTCLKTIRHADCKPEDHVCGYYTCKSCQGYVDPEHLCYARAHQPSSEGGRRYIFADIEASQKDELVQCDFGYTPRPTPDCSRCRDGTCNVCRLCQHCHKSQCGRARHSFVLAVCQTACRKCEKEDLTPDSKCPECRHRCETCSEVDKKTKKYVSPPCRNTC
jgi:hypothetical protein